MTPCTDTPDCTRCPRVNDAWARLAAAEAEVLRLRQSLGLPVESGHRQPWEALP